ncbi:major capsid protein [Pseudoalteromonas sp. GABNS16G]|uniref:major capsid protein n=1 Tax=Pseudoalteromonas sp. GABNS16G TaxID=3025324 RepID=UPI00235818A9|nr:major capsid protein [Pseudoalteromonas sp. GABNS16G]MDC9602915.1 major capsid protein [Pseudoalteromonas sp. GABNS16G]
MTTRLTDIFKQESYLRIPSQERTTKNNIINSPAVVGNAQAQEFLNLNMGVGTLYSWNLLDDKVEANYGNDNPADTASVTKMSEGSQVARMIRKNKFIETTKLASAFGNKNVLSEGRRQIGTYRVGQDQTSMIRMLDGITAAGEANTTGSFIVDDGTSTLNQSLITKAAKKMGDNFGNMSLLVVTSAQYFDLFGTLPPSFDPRGDSQIRQYLGMTVIVNDELPTVETGADTGIFRHRAYMLTAGAVAYESSVYAAGITGDEKAANGEGVESLYERWKSCLHVDGVSWAGNTGADESPSWADLANPANYQLKHARKNIGIVGIDSYEDLN